jgi:selenocysteine lyase/cysteine desulfurase
LNSLTRVSFGVYNTIEEIDIFVEALKEATLLLCPSLSY